MSIAMDTTDQGRPLEPALAGMLAAIDAGDATVIGMLADWLEERGDPRAALARAATQIDVEAIATLLYMSRHEPAARGVLRGLIVPVLAGDPFAVMDFALGSDSAREECRLEVETALRTRKISAEQARVITIARRAKVDQLLQQFQEPAAVPGIDSKRP
jgi:uncharacterized protein (TIGR02996 family)